MRLSPPSDDPRGGCSPPEFPGFPVFRANVTFVPWQFFTVVVPHRSRGCVRVVGFILRRLLGWVDDRGQPTRSQIQFTYRELIDQAGVSRDAVAAALAEAIEWRLIECLQAPRPDGPGEPAVSGIYQLRWSNKYTDDPTKFAGFVQGEKVGGSKFTGDHPSVYRPSARKNIPNAFFDYLLRRERLSVIRVVGAMLFQSIWWKDGLEHRDSVRISLSDLARLCGMSRRHVHQAVRDAIAAGYVERLQNGRFDPGGGAESEVSVYRIRWTNEPVVPVHRPEPASDAAPVRKGSRIRADQVVTNGSRKRSDLGHGDRSEMGYDPSIKRRVQYRTATAGVDPLPAAADGMRGIVMLRDAGFDEPTARQLAGRYSPEVIERQLEWLPLRQASRNRLGLLRRAIEGNWPPPQACPAPAEEAHGALFVRHFEAALHRLPEVPADCPPNEAKRAAAFLRELPGCPTSDEACAAWGRRFGRFVRGKSPHRPFFLWVIKVFREEFLRLVRDEIRAKSTTSKVRCREEHERRFNSRHLEYLRGVESDLREREPELYREFCVHREQCVAELGLSAQSQAVLAGEVGRLTALAEFLRGRARPVLEFWEWDEQLNPDGWRRAQSESPG